MSIAHMTDKSETVLVIYWEWTEGPHKGARFWGCHSLENDGRIRDWPEKMKLRPIGAATAIVTEGKGLDFVTFRDN